MFKQGGKDGNKVCARARTLVRQRGPRYCGRAQLHSTLYHTGLDTVHLECTAYLDPTRTLTMRAATSPLSTALAYFARYNFDHSRAPRLAAF